MQSDASNANTKLKKRVKKRKKKSMKNGVPNDVDESFWTDLVTEGSMAETNARPANDIRLLNNTAEKPEQPDNLVLRKLLRGPRYFDPPDDSWGNCYNCGRRGHRTIDCAVEKKKKPCFLCGSIEHIIKKCKKERKCVICKTKGHRGRQCPEKSNNSKNGSTTGKICLRCGDNGHDMFSCRNSYFPVDLKVVQCYICNGFGHLCCYTAADHVSKELSCYKCGGLGHNGLACARLAGEASGISSPTLCYNCFQGGHFSRECPHPLKDSKCDDLDTCMRNVTTVSDENGGENVGHITKDF